MADMTEKERRLQSFELVSSDITCGEAFSVLEGSAFTEGQSFSHAVKKTAAALSKDECLIAATDNPLGIQFLLGYRDNEGLLPFSTFAHDDMGRRIDYAGLLTLKKELTDQVFLFIAITLFQTKKLHPPIFRKRAAGREGAEIKICLDR